MIFYLILITNLNKNENFDNFVRSWLFSDNNFLNKVKNKVQKQYTVIWFRIFY